MRETNPTGCLMRSSHYRPDLVRYGTGFFAERQNHSAVIGEEIFRGRKDVVCRFQTETQRREDDSTLRLGDADMVDQLAVEVQCRFDDDDVVELESVDLDVVQDMQFGIQRRIGVLLAFCPQETGYVRRMRTFVVCNGPYRIFGSSHKCMHDSGMISPITRRPKDEE